MELTNLCKELSVLPRPGGLFDQDPYIIEGMKMVLAAYAEKLDKERNRKK